MGANCFPVDMKLIVKIQKLQKFACINMSVFCKVRKRVMRQIPSALQYDDCIFVHSIKIYKLMEKVCSNVYLINCFSVTYPFGHCTPRHQS